MTIDKSPISFSPPADSLAPLRDALLHYWGYDSFRPLQAEAMQAVVEHRDSLVVLPTGGGKSICFQAPAVTMPGLAVIVSPLISLMERIRSTRLPRMRDFRGVREQQPVGRRTQTGRRCHSQRRPEAALRRPRAAVYRKDDGLPGKPADFLLRDR